MNSVIKDKTFDKKSTQVTKGILIIMMLVHHVLQGYLVEGNAVHTLFHDMELYNNIVNWCKICISGFVFLSAYGYTCKLKEIQKEDFRSLFKNICGWIIRLEAVIIPIYIISICYKHFIIHESIIELYTYNQQFHPIYIIIDMLGLACYFGTPEINITWWYMYIAFLLILSIPFLLQAYKKWRYVLIPISLFLPLQLSSLEVRAGVQSNYAMLFPSMILGMAFAYEDWFTKIMKLQWNNKGLSYIVKLILASAFCSLSFVMGKYVKMDFAYVFGFSIPLLSYLFFERVPIIKNVLMIIGKHATNIFLIHTFIYYYWYTKFIYSFKYDGLIIVVLLCICVLVSGLLELIKRFGYNKLVNKLLCVVMDKEE